MQARARCRAQTPFVAAAQVSADGRPERLRLSPVAGFRKRAINGTCHACAARYAGSYLAESSYRFNRRYELSAYP